MLTFDFEDYRQAHEECLERFKHNLLITASINSLRELFLSGKDQYLIGNNHCQLMNHSALGFRIIAANIFAVMFNVALKEHYGEAHNQKFVCHISGTEPDYDKMKKFMNKNCIAITKKILNRPNVGISEPALDKWQKVFNIPYSINVDLNTLYYTNDNTEKTEDK